MTFSESQLQVQVGKQRQWQNGRPGGQISIIFSILQRRDSIHIREAVGASKAHNVPIIEVAKSNF